MSKALKKPMPIKTGFLKTLRMLRQSYRNPLVHGQALQAEHGNVVMQMAGGIKMVHLFGADAHQLCLLNPNQILSNKKAWDRIIGRVFPNGLMLRDGDDHRYHRRLMQAGFKSSALQTYAQTMLPQTQAAIAGWTQGQTASWVPVYPKFKQLTLDLAATIFLGMDLGFDATRINRAFETTVAASMPRVPVPIPGNLLWRGIRAREAMVKFFLSQIPSKRQGDGQDLFSLLCRAEDESGDRYTDQEIVDHMIFLMMAAHDTTTSTLTTLVYALGKDPAWQERLRAKSLAMGSDFLDFDQLGELAEHEWCMNEALRMYPPLTSMPRGVAKDCEFRGYRLHRGELVGISPILTHYLPEYWSNPYAFDPERFSPGRAEQKKNFFQFIPFGGGHHACLGQHFASIQVKAILHQMLRRYRWSVPADYTIPYQLVPIVKPRDDLPVKFARIG